MESQLMENAVALAAIGVMATAMGVLVWVIQKQFTQNDTTIKQNTNVNLSLAKSIDNLNLTMKLNDENRLEFQTGVVATLKKLSDTQDVMVAQQECIYTTVTAKTMNVEQMNVAHETVKK